MRTRLSALIDNHIHFGNTLQFDDRRIAWRRVVDINDRALRKVIVGLGPHKGYLREDGFDIVVASEVMAIATTELQPCAILANGPP